MAKSKIVSDCRIIYEPKTKASERPKITTSRDAYEVLYGLHRETISTFETAFALLLNRANKVVCSFKLSEGGVAGTVIDPKKLFQAALLNNCSAIVLSHNHPSGELIPSGADKAITKKIKEGAKLLDMMLLDHLILAEDKFYSFADEGEI